MALSVMRYPGSKERLWGRMAHLFPSRCDVYHEPFVGGGAVAVRVMRAGIPRRGVILSDADPLVCAVWEAVRDHADELSARLLDYTPRAEDYYRFRDDPGTHLGVVETAFRKIVLHQISYSSLGPIAGSPIGGRFQKGAWLVGCLYDGTRVARRVKRCAALMRGYDVSVRCEPFGLSLTRCGPGDFAYLDPPYYAPGRMLYKHDMTSGDHAALAVALKDAPCRWLLSYDDRPEVRGLYAGCRVDEFEMTVMTDRKVDVDRQVRRELLVTPAPRPRPVARTPSAS